MDSYQPIITNLNVPYSPPTDITMIEEEKQSQCDKCLEGCCACCNTLMDSMCCLSIGCFLMSIS